MKDFPSSKGFPQLFAGLAALSLSLVVSSLIAAKAIGDLKQANDVLVVTGSAKNPIRSDYMIWRLSISSQQTTAEAAYQDLARQSQRLQAYLKEKKVPEGAITITAIETTSIPKMTANGQDTGEILAYRLTQRLEIRSDQVDQYTELSRQSTELINEGINLVSEPPEYLYTKLDQLRVKMMSEATKDAKSRADAIAQATNNRVGRVRSAKAGVFQITSRNSTDVSDSGLYDTSSIDKDITAVVSVTFSIE